MQADAEEDGTESSLSSGSLSMPPGDAVKAALEKIVNAVKGDSWLGYVRPFFCELSKYIK